MNLAQLIRELKLRGDMMSSWDAVATNVESVSELKGSMDTGKYWVELKLQPVSFNDSTTEELLEIMAYNQREILLFGKEAKLKTTSWGFTPYEQTLTKLNC